MQAVERRCSSRRLFSVRAMGSFCVKSGDRDSVLLRRKMCARNGVWSVLEEGSSCCESCRYNLRASCRVKGPGVQAETTGRLESRGFWRRRNAGMSRYKEGRLELEGTPVVAHELMPGRTLRSAGDATNGGAVDQARVLGEPNGQRCPRRHEGKTSFAWSARKVSEWDLVRSRLEERQRAAGQMGTGGNSTKQTRQPNRGNANERLRGGGNWRKWSGSLQIRGLLRGVPNKEQRLPGGYRSS